MIINSPPPNWGVGFAFSFTFTASGGTPPYGSWYVSAGSLPPGLNLNASTGVLSGLAPAAGVYGFTVTASDSLSNTASLPCSMSILGIANSPPEGAVGTPYSYTFAAAYGVFPITLTITSGSLPPGLDLDASTGLLAGVPSVGGPDYNFSLEATDAAGVIAEVTVNISIFSISGSLPEGAVGTPYSYGFTAANGTPPYTWAVSGGSLPPGLSLNASTGVLSGIPTTGGSYAFTVLVGDALSLYVTLDCSTKIVSIAAALSRGRGRNTLFLRFHGGKRDASIHLGGVGWLFTPRPLAECLHGRPERYTCHKRDLSLYHPRDGRYPVIWLGRVYGERVGGIWIAT